MFKYMPLYIKLRRSYDKDIRYTHFCMLNLNLRLTELKIHYQLVVGAVLVTRIIFHVGKIFYLRTSRKRKIHCRSSHKNTSKDQRLLLYSYQ